jgi:hypothetical protein
MVKTGYAAVKLHLWRLDVSITSNQLEEWYVRGVLKLEVHQAVREKETSIESECGGHVG